MVCLLPSRTYSYWRFIAELTFGEFPRFVEMFWGQEEKGHISSLKNEVQLENINCTKTVLKSKLLPIFSLLRQTYIFGSKNSECWNKNLKGMYVGGNLPSKTYDFEWLAVLLEWKVRNPVLTHSFHMRNFSNLSIVARKKNYCIYSSVNWSLLVWGQSWNEKNNLKSPLQEKSESTRCAYFSIN